MAVDLFPQQCEQTVSSKKLHLMRALTVSICIIVGKLFSLVWLERLLRYHCGGRRNTPMDEDQTLVAMLRHWGKKLQPKSSWNKAMHMFLDVLCLEHQCHSILMCSEFISLPSWRLILRGARVEGRSVKRNIWNWGGIQKVVWKLITVEISWDLWRSPYWGLWIIGDMKYQPDIFCS